MPDELADIWARAGTPAPPRPVAPTVAYGVKASADQSVRLRRVTALVIDACLWFAFATAVTWGQTITVGDSLLLILGNMSYYVLLEWLCGATIGKGIMGLRVVRTDGRAAGLGRVIVRQLMAWVDALIVGYVVALVTGGHRRVGDFAAGTMIARAA